MVTLARLDWGAGLRIEHVRIFLTIESSKPTVISACCRSFGNDIASRGLNPAMAAYRGTAPENERWWTTSKHNGNQVTNGGVWVGAIAVMDDFEAFSLLTLPFNGVVFGRMFLRRMTQCFAALPVLMLVVEIGRAHV